MLDTIPVSSFTGVAMKVNESQVDIDYESTGPDGNPLEKSLNVVLPLTAPGVRVNPNEK